MSKDVSRRKFLEKHCYREERRAPAFPCGRILPAQRHDCRSARLATRAPKFLFWLLAVAAAF